VPALAEDIDCSLMWPADLDDKIAKKRVELRDEYAQIGKALVADYPEEIAALRKLVALELSEEESRSGEKS